MPENRLSVLALRPDEVSAFRPPAMAPAYQPMGPLGPWPQIVDGVGRALHDATMPTGGWGAALPETGNMMGRMVAESGLPQVAALTHGGPLRPALEVLSQIPTPVGDAAALALVPGDLARGEWLDAGLNALGVLPFIPAMARFRSSGMSHKNSMMERMADQVERAARAMGLETSWSSSKQSASQYLRISTPDENRILDIRISDHSRPMSAHTIPDMEFREWHSPREIVEAIAETFNTQVPRRWTEEAVEARQAAARAAAETTAARRHERFKEFIEGARQQAAERNLQNARQVREMLDDVANGVPAAWRQQAYRTLVSEAHERADMARQARIESNPRSAAAARAAQTRAAAAEARKAEFYERVIEAAKQSGFMPADQWDMSRFVRQNQLDADDILKSQTGERTILPNLTHRVDLAVREHMARAFSDPGRIPDMSAQQLMDLFQFGHATLPKETLDAARARLIELKAQGGLVFRPSGVPRSVWGIP